MCDRLTSSIDMELSTDMITDIFTDTLMTSDVVSMIDISSTLSPPYMIPITSHDIISTSIMNQQSTVHSSIVISNSPTNASFFEMNQVYIISSIAAVLLIVAVIFILLLITIICCSLKMRRRRKANVTTNKHMKDLIINTSYISTIEQPSTDELLYSTPDGPILTELNTSYTFTDELHYSTADDMIPNASYIPSTTKECSNDNELVYSTVNDEISTELNTSYMSSSFTTPTADDELYYTVMNKDSAQEEMIDNVTYGQY